jgi:hypothetical protein
MTAARVTYYGVIVSVAAASAIGAAVLAPGIGLAVGAGAIFTRRIVKDESNRQLELRRARAKQVFRAYVDDVGFVLTKESRDAVKRAQRHLRDDFGRRARLVNHGQNRAYAAAREAASAEDRVSRLADAERRWGQLQELTSRLGGERV